MKNAFTKAEIKYQLVPLMFTEAMRRKERSAQQKNTYSQDYVYATPDIQLGTGIVLSHKRRSR